MPASAATTNHDIHPPAHSPAGMEFFRRIFSGHDDFETNIEALRHSADRLCLLVAFFCFTLAQIEGFLYQNLHDSLLFGVPLLALSTFAVKYRKYDLNNMYLSAFVFVGFSALHIHLARGMIEFHFSIFVLLSVLLAYRDPRPIVLMGVTTLIHHILFDYLQQRGYECYVFRGPYSGLSAIALHGFYVASAVGVLSMIAQMLKRHAVMANESARLIAQLDHSKGVDLRTRAVTDEYGNISPIGRVFNDYADNMSFILASFKMLRSDVRELSQIAQDLGIDNNLLLENTSTASKNLRDFIQNISGQTKMGQSTAELSKKMTEDCFDLINELSQSVTQLQKITKHTYDCTQMIDSITKGSSPEAITLSASQLAGVRSSLETLAERTQGFVSRFDVIKNGLSAIENQAVTIDRSTHQWVENGHINQRRGWEVLGAMESLQSRAENAFRTLNNSVQTILRSEDLIREMEKRLSRFQV